MAAPARIFYEKDASLEALSGKTIVFVGYGNQGRAQALNLRDTLSAHPVPNPPQILIANPSDTYSARATSDSFATTTDFTHAASIADILFLLVPDQIQPHLFNTRLAPTLKPTCAIVVASGYNIFYRTLHVPPTADVLMLAPRMIGDAVRSRFVSGKGFPSFVSVEQDGTGDAWATTLALAQGIGALQAPGGAIESSVREETLMDLFAEQAIWPQIIAVFREAYNVLKARGCSDEALCHELWMSGEPAEVFEKMAEMGFVRQLVLHSSVSQYGQLKGSGEVEMGAMRREFERVADQRILGGDFAREFGELSEGEGADGKGVQRRLEELYKVAAESELAVGERRVRERMGMKTD